MKTLLSILLTSLLLFTACSNEEQIVTSDSLKTIEEDAIAKLIDEDEAILSFEPNFNEEDIMGFLGKVEQSVYPVRVGQRMRLTDVSRELDIQGDSAFVSVTKTFEGTLFIAASYDEFTFGDPNAVDTLLQKSFVSQVKRNIILVKIANTDFPSRNWRIKAISLPEGEMSPADNIVPEITINKMTITFEDGNVMEVTDPTEYYLSRMPGLNNQIPVFGRGEEITVNIELQSAYSDTDFVSITWGALYGMPYHRTKRKFDLVSSQFDGTNYNKVYQQTFTTHFIPGFRHAIINAMPKQVVYDDSTPVEGNSWGMPYAVK